MANKADDTFRDRAPKVLEKRFAEMMAHEPGTRAGEDPEELHDMRVASRRLRAALDAFGVCYGGREFQRVARQTKELTGALGEVRDRDVLIAQMEAYRETVPPDEQPAIAQFLDRLHAERVAHRATLIAYFDTLAVSDYAKRFPRAVAHPKN